MAQALGKNAEGEEGVMLVRWQQRASEPNYRTGQHRGAGDNGRTVTCRLFAAALNTKRAISPFFRVFLPPFPPARPLPPRLPPIPPPRRPTRWE